ncbi:hypothetical protein [Streptacidiphilus sp. P02-A3a]|uniref:hypothetical protein n=1 Tax=Streptacidiphilus sp. P02-A3a TaxID=2704468 RepID=UPI0015F7CFD0|nr:hypothetical protein [Streptacidiphilus sp. P02-A3a]QMU68869.1 hypothetical protein GXP74_12140 [Streptacidiphilus sp. P02-A3a]
MLTRQLISGRAGAATVTAACALLFGVLAAPSASASGGGGGGGSCDPVTGVCTISASTPPSSGSGGGGGGGNKGGKPVCSYQGNPVSCMLPGYGDWDGVACYDSLDDPQPPASATVWYGHNPADGGAIYWEYCPYTGGAAGQEYYLAYLPTPPPGQPAQESPGQIAADMLKTLKIPALTIDSAPSAQGRGLVGLPVWLWATSKLSMPDLYGRAGNVKVTMKVSLGHITWNTGGGDFSCNNVTTAYQARDGLEAPVCGFASGFATSGRHTVTATAHWGVTWQSNIGISQPVPIPMTAATQITLTIDQAQALNVTPQETP